VHHTSQVVLWPHWDDITHADPSMDHRRALRSNVAPLLRVWNCRSGRPCQTVESDIAPLNIGLATALPNMKHKKGRHGGLSLLFICYPDDFCCCLLFSPSVGDFYLCFTVFHRFYILWVIELKLLIKFCRKLVCIKCYQ